MEPASNDSGARLQHILVCGSGLAAQMTVAALSHHLPPSIRVTWLKIPGTEAKDRLYGSVAPPTAYDFNLNIGVEEPALVLGSNTAFSYGTRYSQWGAKRRDWIQAFQAPFPVIEGVLFYHYLVRSGVYDIAPYLVAAAAARNGVFAHPPEDQRHPLSRAEYGYQFEPAAYGAVFERRVGPAVTTIAGTIAGVARDGDDIRSVDLTGGPSLVCDLYIDCTGPDALLASQFGTLAGPSRRLNFLSSQAASAELGPPVRTVTAGSFGWSAQTPVEGATLRMTVYARDDEDKAVEAHGDPAASRSDFTTGRRAMAWTGNCVAIGHAAGVVEPVTPAPFMLLQRDIDRLMALLPISPRMAVERREFNRQYADDYDHAVLFNRALFDLSDADYGAYLQGACESPADERLAGKIAQFESRGLHVAYDLEPFGLEDWVILHLGMGRRPERYDRVADSMPRDKMDQYLGRMRQDIAQAVKTMPPHGAYRQGLAKFLKQQSLVS